MELVRICNNLPDIALLLTYETVQAPPAIVFWQPLHFQMPTECRLTVFLPQNVQMYRACWVISIFLTCFRREAPYRVPYLPVTPTSVRLSMNIRRLGVGDCRGLTLRALRHFGEEGQRFVEDYEG